MRTRLLLCSILIIFTLPLWSDTPLPDVGASASQALSPAQENTLGDFIMESLRAQHVINNDPELADYVQSLGNRLVKHSEDAKRPYHFFVVNEPHVNAFALPGAWIGIHSGLLLQTRRESELAAVLAHEIAHVSQRHISRMFEKAKQMTLPSIAALIGAAALAVAVPGAGTAAIAGVMAGSQQAQIDFTRHNEEEADRIGIDTLAKSDFDVNSMAGFFGRMQELSRYNDTQQLPEFLRTHPMSTNRMADAQSRAERYKNNTTKESAIYPFMKERLRVLSMAASDARAYYAKVKLESDSIRYGHAFMLFHIERNPKAAQQMLAPLVEPGMQPPVAILQATLLAENGQIKEGLQLARTTQQQFPANKGLTLELTDLYLKYQHPEAAKTFMRHELLRNPDDSDYYARLAKAYLALGEKKLAYLANGDYSMALHVFHQAMFQLTLAEKTPPKSPYYQALIAAKIKENEGLLERQKKLRKSLGIPAG